jgi:CRP-like cAMP-binding protein
VLKTTDASTAWEALTRALSPVEDRPRLLPDVESATYRTRGGADYVVIHSPSTRAYARLDPREFQLLPLMDGQHSVKDLVIAYYQRHGLLALARVAGLVRLLRQQHFLIEACGDSYAALGTRLRGPGRLVRKAELTTRALDAVLANVYRQWGHFFFHRAWLLVGLALGLLGPLLVFVEMARGRYTLYPLGGSGALTVVLLVAMALLVLAIHELGHGLAVKHAGRRVNEAGVRLYFGLPAAFVDTTDIWMAPPRQRLLTAFAGPWTGLVLGGVCALAAVLGETGPVGAFLFTAAFVFMVDNLFNFNPLLELDGYYMLIDFLDVPLLRARALAFVRRPLWGRLWQRQALNWEERFLAWFGLGSLAYGVIAVGLAARAWQALLLPVVISTWQGGEILGQLEAVLIVIAVAVPLLLTAVSLARRMIGPAGAGLTWLGGRADEHRHRAALAALRAVTVWSTLPTPRLLEVARAMRTKDVPRGIEVVRQGEAGDSFFVIAAGAFEVVVDGQPQVRLERGEYFGERALLQRVPRAATVLAIEPSRVFVLDRTDFDALLAGDLAVHGQLQAALVFRDEVADMALFRDLSPAELDLLLARLVPLELATGETIIRQHEPGQRFYVIRSGGVDVERDGQRLARLGPGEAFGEIALLLDQPRSATVTALEPTRLLALEAHDFRDLLAGYLGRAGELEQLSYLRLRTHKRLDEVV